MDRGTGKTGHERRWPVLLVKDLADLSGQGEWREGLLEEVDVGLQDTVAHHGVIGVTAQVEHLHPGEFGLEDISQFASDHMGHHQVGRQQVDLAGMLSGDSHSLQGVSGMQDAVAAGLQGT